MANFASALDGAVAVVAEEIGEETTIISWFGGTTFNVYNVYDGRLREIDVFSVSDNRGMPVEREIAFEHMNDWMEDNVQ